MDNIYIFISFLVNIGISCVLGAATKKINESKGYFGGFAWGFWLGVIGLLVVLCRSEALYTPTESIIVSTEQVNYEPAPQGGWTCTCGRGNAQYVSTCVCGINKRDALTSAKTE